MNLYIIRTAYEPLSQVRRILKKLSQPEEIFSTSDFFVWQHVPTVFTRFLAALNWKPPLIGSRTKWC